MPTSAAALAPPLASHPPCSDSAWSAFQHINRSRRAVRHFDAAPLPDADVEAVLREALLAPSSNNSQPYVIHWLRDPAVLHAAAAACRNQRAARSASALLVFVAAPRFARDTLALFRDSLDSSPELSPQSRAYHCKQCKAAATFLRLAPSFLWTPLYLLLTALFPSLTLLPLGPQGIRNWAARNALFAAQTALLAASARGLDSCPMEGFNPRKLARLLGLQRGDVIALVLALGRRNPDARLEPRWRRPFSTAIQIS
ncbi:nitroreductase family protein [Acidobacteria bacterium AB60]|nr:nitroreductase family protein [Acidobacteria bacterium AB60]